MDAGSDFYVDGGNRSGSLVPNDRIVVNRNRSGRPGKGMMCDRIVVNRNSTTTSITGVSVALERGQGDCGG